MHDVVAEHALSLLRVVGRVLAAVLRFLFVNLLTNLVLFNVGRVTLLAVTVGRYPRGRMLVAHEERIVACGVLVLVLAWCAIVLYNHFGAVGASL
jgi:hypothetical protein